MNLKIIFKRLVLLNLLITLFFVISIFFIPESGMVESFNQSVEVHDVYSFLAIIWILAFFFNIYLLYNFKKFGKQNHEEKQNNFNGFREGTPFCSRF